MSDSRNFIFSILWFIARVFMHVLHVTSQAIARYRSPKNSAPSEFTTHIRKNKVKRVAIIGAGPSGLTTLKTCLEHGNFRQVVCFEASDHIGGIWNYQNEKTPMYDSLNTNTSKYMMHFSDFTMPDSYPDYPTHYQVQSYLENYANKFDLMSYIKLNHSVVKLEEKSNGDSSVWTVSYQATVGDHAGQIIKEEFDAVAICNGHYSVPLIPDSLKDLSKVYKKATRIIHSRDFRSIDLSTLADKVCLVVGISSSGADIASKLTTVAKKTYVSCADYSVVFPKYCCGRPLDHSAYRRIITKLPQFLSKLYFNLTLWAHLPTTAKNQHLNMTSPVKVGGNVNPGFNTEILQYIAHGKTKIRLPVVEFNETKITFADGKSCSPDYIIFATGYEHHYPFLDKTNPIITLENNIVKPLYKHLLHIEKPSLAFIGLLTKVHPFPVVEAQARLVEMAWSGEVELPSTKEMHQHTKAREDIYNKFGINLRYWNREEHCEYLYDLAKQCGYYPHSMHWSNSKYFKHLLFYPVSPLQFRICGKGAKKGAAEKLSQVWK